MLTEFFAAEVTLSIILASLVLFMAYKYRDIIRSKRGKKTLKDNMLVMKVGVALALMSLFVFLAAESLEVLEGSFAPGYNLSKFHEIGEAVHVFFSILALGIFIQVLDDIRRRGG